MTFDLLPTLSRCRLVPVITIDSAADALPLADALLSGGLPILEITFRTAAAEDAVRAIANHGKALVGVGTILNIEGAKRAIGAGASFLVSPGFSAKLLEFCLSQKIPLIPGAANATDLQIAVGEYALPLVKFFPAESLGGVAMIKALSAPFAAVKFMPTGGITAENISTYLSCPAVLACGGSWMVKADLIRAQRFEDIRSLTAAAVAAIASRNG